MFNVAIHLEEEFKEDDTFINDLKTVLKIAKIGFTNATGGALHRLHATKPSIDAVKELVNSIPDALSFKNEKGQLPVQSAVWHDAVKYIPILAKEGIKHEIGGRGMRGGLLVADPEDDFGKNSLQLIVGMYNVYNPIHTDTVHLDVLKELRKDKLLLKSDIKDHHFLYPACNIEYAIQSQK